MRPYIDCHNHIGRTLNRIPPTGQNTQMCLSRFAETEIYATISMPTAVGSSIVRGLEDIRDQNQVISRACRNYPERFPFGLALVEPRLGQYAVEEAERALDDPNFDGIAGHPPMKDEI